MLIDAIIARLSVEAALQHHRSTMSLSSAAAAKERRIQMTARRARKPTTTPLQGTRPEMYGMFNFLDV